MAVLSGQAYKSIESAKFRAPVDRQSHIPLALIYYPAGYVVVVVLCCTTTAATVVVVAASAAAACIYSISSGAINK